MISLISLEKIWPVKSLSSEKSLNFPPSRCILHNLVHFGGNVEYLIFSSDFLNFTRMSFDISSIVSQRQSLVSVRVS